MNEDREDRRAPLATDEAPSPPPLPPWARHLTRALDDLLRIPGTERGVGLDALIGFLLPGAGDAVTAVGSVSLLVLALQRGVPKVVLFRMIMNLGVDAFLGAVPIVGDLFDVAFRANRRNLELIEKHQRHGRPAGVAEYAVVGLGFLVVALAIALPVALGVFLGGELLEWARSR